MAEFIAVLPSSFLVKWQWEPGLNGLDQGTIYLPEFPLQQRLSMGMVLPPRGELVIYGDSFHCHTWGSTTGIHWVGSRTLLNVLQGTG